jgi:hypothetical protein
MLTRGEYNELSKLGAVKPLHVDLYKYLYEYLNTKPQRGAQIAETIGISIVKGPVLCVFVNLLLLAQYCNIENFHTDLNKDEQLTIYRSGNLTVIRYEI